MSFFLLYLYVKRILLFKGILFSTKESTKSPLDLVRLWNHECCRVYRDKLVDSKDMELFDKLQDDFNKKLFDVSIYGYLFLILTLYA